MTPTEDREIVELSEFIALRHEERPTVVPPLPPHPLMGAPCSNGGWWIWTATDVKLVGSTGAGHTEAVCEWVAADCTTPYNAMRLLKELLADWIVSIDWSSQLKNYEVTLDSKSSNESHIGVGDSLELATALAYKKAVESK